MIMIQPWLFVSQGWVSLVSATVRISRIRADSETRNPTPALIFLILKHQNPSHPESGHSCCLMKQDSHVKMISGRDCLHELNMIPLILTRLRFFSGPVCVLVLMTKYRVTPVLSGVWPWCDMSSDVRRCHKSETAAPRPRPR